MKIKPSPVVVDLTVTFETTQDCVRFMQKMSADETLKSAAFREYERTFGDLVRPECRGNVTFVYPVPEAILTDEQREGIFGFMRLGNKIEAIKGLRAATGMGLKEAKDWVEAQWV